MPIPAWIALSGVFVASCVCVYASLILWAKVWNERRRHVADGEVRETLTLPLNVGMRSPRFIASPTPKSSTGPHVPPLFLTISQSLTFLNSSSLSDIHFSLLSSQTFAFYLLFLLHAPFSFALLSHLTRPPLPFISLERNLISPSSWSVHNSPSLLNW